MKKRQPSKTPYTRGCPLARERGTAHQTGGSSGKAHSSESNWLQRFLKAYFAHHKTPEIISTKGVDYYVDREKNQITFVRPLQPGETMGNEIPNPNETEE